MRYRIPFNFMFQVLIQSALFTEFQSSGGKKWKYGSLFCNRPLHTEFDENTFGDLLREASHVCVPFHL
jgi:hypothetical protein